MLLLAEPEDSSFDIHSHVCMPITNNLDERSLLKLAILELQFAASELDLLFIVEQPLSERKPTCPSGTLCLDR